MISDVSDISAHYGGLLIILIFTAMNKNFEDYLKAILAHYELAKNGRDADLLEHPTPGNLKKLCIQFLERGLSSADEKAFLNFFHPKDEKALPGLIKNMNADGLRTPSDFLRSGLGLTNNRQHANLVAVLVGFEPRPFTKFQDILHEEKEEMPKDSLEEKTIVVEKRKSVAEKETETEFPNKESKPTSTTAPFPKSTRNAFIVLAVLLFCGLSGFIVYKSTEEKCMIWKDDHFERTDCEPTTISSFVNAVKIHPFNEEAFEKQHKIIPTDTTTFFKNGEPVLFYLKKDNKCDFFTLPGLHPVYRKALRPVSERIVRKYSGVPKYMASED